MKMRVCGAVVLMSVLGASSAWAVKLDMAPGLWDMGYTMKSQSGDVEKALELARQQLAGLPPEQRKMMEDMLAKQGVALGEDANSVKLCITQEQLDKGQLPQQDSNCSQSITESGKNTYQISLECKGNPPTSGTGTITFSDAKNYTGTFVMNASPAGKPDVMTIQQTGKWLSADCGNIRPIGN